MLNKKVVLITPDSYESHSAIRLKDNLALPAVPLAIVALGSFLMQHGINVELMDVQMDFGLALTEAAKRSLYKQIVLHLYHQQDDILWIGMSCLSRAHLINGLILGKQIKNDLPDIPLIFGGYFPSGQYPYLMNTFSFIDGIVYGDGEIASLEITSRLAHGFDLSTNIIPNWVFRSASRTLVRSREIPSSMDIDSLPELDYTLLKNHREYPIGSIVTARGCPFQCEYCVEPAMRSYRPISLSKLTDTFLTLDVILPCKYMFIYDPLFGLGKRRTKKLIEIFKLTKFKYVLESRADVLDPNLVAELGVAGVDCISLGIESASYNTLMRMNKVRDRSHYQKYISQAREIIAECFANNITVFVGVMLGYPGDTKNDTQKTLDFLDSITTLHDEKYRETGNAPGFVAFPNHVKVYPQTQLFSSMSEYPDVHFRAEDLPGEYLVISPSPGYSFDDLNKHFRQFEQMNVITPIAQQRINRYVGMTIENLLASFPNLISNDTINWKCLKEYENVWS